MILLFAVAHAQEPAPPAVVTPAPPAPPAPAGTPLSLEDALRQAQASSEGIDIAEARIDQADGDRWVARSGYFPQISASLTYQHTFESEFDDLFAGFGAPPGGIPTTGTPVTTTGTPPTTSTTTPTTTATTPPTTTSAPSGAGGGEDSGGSLPFGQPNTWRAGFTVQQGIYGGGRAGAYGKMAAAGRRSASIGLESARATSVLDTATAYYDAALSDRLLEIATSSLAQSEAALKQTELTQGVGRSTEFELLRARVVADNQRVATISAQRQREVAHQRLLQLLDLPPGTALALTSPLEEPDVTELAVKVSGADPSRSERAPVRQLTQTTAIAVAGVALARADALPSLGASANIGWVGYPSELLPFGGDTPWYASINGTVGLSVPLLNGGRLWGAYETARGVAAEADAVLAQTSELAELDAQQTRANLDAAEAQWAATDGVVEQARRAYQIAELRFTEGVSTQLELSDARLQLEQALVNRARTARDLAVARIRIALLSSLPLSSPF